MKTRTVNHNMVYLTLENLKLRPFYRHEIGVNKSEQSQTNPPPFHLGI